MPIVEDSRFRRDILAAPNILSANGSPHPQSLGHELLYRHYTQAAEVDKCLLWKERIRRGWQNQHIRENGWRFPILRHSRRGKKVVNITAWLNGIGIEDKTQLAARGFVIAPERIRTVVFGAENYSSMKRRDPIHSTLPSQ
jgi:hypothetical protein